MALTETELQTQWQNAVDLLEKTRVHIDDTLAGTGNEWDVLLQSLEGEITPTAIGNAVANYRAICSTLIDSGMAQDFISPIIFEYASIIEADAGGTRTFGSGYTDLGSLFSALYEWFNDNSLTVQSRNITYDTSATAGGSNVGNGAFERLTVDSNGFNLEACHVERKIFRCRADQNSGTEEHAEVFEFLGAQRSIDAVDRAAFGSGEISGDLIVSKNAGSGGGGSLCQNSSFSTFDSAAASKKFAGWTETFGGAAVLADVTEDTTNFYRSHPGASTDGSLKISMDASGDTVTLKQTLEDMRISRLDSNRPYFLRVMLNKTVGTAVGGSINLRMGSHSATVTIAGMAANWTELIVAANQNSWFRNFNEDPFDIEVEWTGGTSGYMLFDDLIFAPYDIIDGTYWWLRGNAATHTPWLVDDTLTFTDTGGAPATGKIQWWLFVAGLGYLPSTTGTPTLADP